MKFSAKVIRSSADIAVFDIEAIDRCDATLQILAQGHVLIALHARQGTSLAWRKRRQRFPLALFSQELLALLRAGLAIVEAIETLADKEERPEVERVLRQIIEALYEGRPLSYAIAHSGAEIPPLYIATLRASERTGALEEALARYIDYQDQVDRLRRHLVGASIYPMVLAVVGVLVTTFLMMYVVPRFSIVYADLGGELPWASRWLMTVGQFLGENRLPILTVAAGAVLAVAHTLRLPSVQARCMRKAWELPVIGAKLRLFYLSRIYRTLGMLLRGGLPVATALPMAGDLLQAHMRAQLAQAATHINEGNPISRSMERFGLTTAVAVRMMRVGERTGQMGEMMERIAGFYEEELGRWIEHFTKLFEPLLMIAIGVMIGVIVVLMYLPIFDLAGNLQ